MKSNIPIRSNKAAELRWSRNTTKINEDLKISKDSTGTVGSPVTPLRASLGLWYEIHISYQNIQSAHLYYC